MDSIHFKLKQINVNKLASESKAKPNEFDKLLVNLREQTGSTLEITFLDIKVCKGEILIGNPTLEVQTHHKDIGTFITLH